MHESRARALQDALDAVVSSRAARARGACAARAASPPVRQVRRCDGAQVRCVRCSRCGTGAPTHPSTAPHPCTAPHPTHHAPAHLQHPAHRSAPDAPSAPSVAPVAPVLDPASRSSSRRRRRSHWTPALVGAARVTYSDAKLGVDDSRDIVVITPIVDGPMPVDWEHAEPADFTVRELAREPRGAAAFDTGARRPPPTPKKYAQWTKDFTRWAGQSQTIELLRSPRTKLVSAPDESERDFRIRLQTTLREQRDAEIAKVRERYASKLATLPTTVCAAPSPPSSASRSRPPNRRCRRASRSPRRSSARCSVARRSAPARSGRATTAARGVGRIGRASQDVARAESRSRRPCRRSATSSIAALERRAAGDRRALGRPRRAARARRRTSRSAAASRCSWWHSSGSRTKVLSRGVGYNPPDAPIFVVIADRRRAAAAAARRRHLRSSRSPT